MLGRGFYVMDYVPGWSPLPGGTSNFPRPTRAIIAHAHTVPAGRVIDVDNIESVTAADRARILDHLNFILAELHGVDYEAVGTRTPWVSAHAQPTLHARMTLGLANHGKSGDYAKRQVDHVPANPPAHTSDCSPDVVASASHMGQAVQARVAHHKGARVLHQDGWLRTAATL